MRNFPPPSTTLFPLVYLFTSRMGHQRDLRTAHEKFEQNMAEGRRRGFFQLLAVPPPEGIFGGWDHTKKPNRYIYTNTTPIEIRSRGKIPPNVKDDTEDSVTFTVTSYHSLLDADQTETCRSAVIQGLPAQKQPRRTFLLGNREITWMSMHWSRR